MPRKITRKRKGKSRRTLRRNRKQKGGDNHNSNNPQTVDENSELSQVMASLPSKIFPRRIDNKLQEAFKRSKIDDAWRTLVTKKERSQPLENILKRIEIDHDEDESDLYDPEILYLLLISRAWMGFFVKDNGGYERAREVFIRQIADIRDSGGFGNLEKNIKHFLHVLSEPKKPNEYNKLMRFMWVNTHLILSVASHVFDMPSSNQNDTRVEDGSFNTPETGYVPTADEENDEQFRSIVRNLRFDGGRKKRKSRKSKKTSKKKTLKMKRKNHNKYLKK